MKKKNNKKWTKKRSGDYPMRKSILIGLIILTTISLAYAINCDDITPPENIPCDIITPVITCEYPYYNLTNLTTNTLIIGNETDMTPVGDGTYNFTFNYGMGDYGIRLCDSSASTITIGYDVGFDYYYIYAIGFLIFFILLILGYQLENAILITLAGMLSAIIGIALFLIGFPNFSSWLTNGLSVTFLGCAFYLILHYWIRQNFWS